jgi:uncharacterized integral membrane protein
VILFSLIFPAVICAVFLTRAYAEIDDRFVAEWAQAHGLTLTARNRPTVRWYLLNARVLRTLGVLAGLFLAPLAYSALGLKIDNGGWLWAFVGYLVGALYAELALTRPPAKDRTASLVPRELTDYLPRKLIWAQRTLGALPPMLCGVALAVDYRPPQQAPPRASVIVVALAAPLGAFALEAVERWLLQRPQPLAHPELLAADDAIRSQSVHSISGSGLAILLLLFALPCAALASSDIQLLRWTMWVPAIVASIGSFVSCLYYGHRAWRVQRPTAALEAQA